MGGKGKQPPAPDYTPIAQANQVSSAESAAVARESVQLGRESLAWAKEQYERDRGVSDQIVAQFMGTSQAEAAAGAADRERYKTVFQPLEDQMVRDAQSYSTPQRQELEASRASAEVAANFDGQRRSALAALESYGVDPSMARSGALDASLRVAQGAAQAGAANQGRLGAEATGRALTGEVVNIGRGYPGSIASAYGTSQQAGQGAVSGQLATTASGAQTMGTGIGWNAAGNGWQNTGNNAIGNWGNNVTSMRNNWSDNQTRRSGQQGQMLGAVMGGLLSPMGGVGSSVLGGGLNMAYKALTG